MTSVVDELQKMRQLGAESRKNARRASGIPTSDSPPLEQSYGHRTALERTAAAELERRSSVGGPSEHYRQRHAPASARNSLASSGKIAEEEWAALFRNNLLRSCWKPGLSQDEVQHILARWEHKLIESMHRWLHPEIWAGFRVWHHRTWPRSLLENARARFFVRFVRPALNRWRSHSRILALGPFLYARLLHVHLRTWRLEAAFLRRAHMCNLLFGFARLRRGVDLERGLRMYMRSLKHRTLRRAFNSWEEERRLQRERIESTMQTIMGWQFGLRRALNTWKGLREAMEEIRLVALRWHQYSIYRLWRRWSITYMRTIFTLRAALTRWLEAALTRCLNTWSAITRARLGNLRLARKACAAFSLRHVRAAYNTWSERMRGELENLNKLYVAVEALSGSKLHRAMNTWRERFDDEARSYALLQRACIGLKTRLLWGFNAWFTALEPGDALINQALGHLIHQQEATAFRTWVFYADERFHALAALSLAAGAFASGELRRALNSWSAHTEERFDSMSLLDRAVRHMLSAGLALGWESWHGYLHMRQVAARAAAGMVYGGLSRGFNTWRGFTDEAGHQMGLLAKSAATLRSVSLRRCWNTLCELLDAPPDPAARAVAHMIQRELARALQTWSEAAGIWLTMMSVLAALTHRRQWRAILTWKEFLEARRDNLATVRRAVTQAMNMGLVRALNKWEAFWTERHNYRQGLVLFIRQAEAAALRAWKAACARFASRLARIESKARAVFDSLPMLKAFNSWTSLLQRLQLARHVGRALLARKERRAFSAWVEQFASSRMARQRAIDALYQLRPEGRTLRRAWSTWSPLGRSWRIARNVLLRLAKRSLARALNAWVQAAADRAAQTAQMMHVARLLSPEGRALLRAFNSLRSLLEACRKLRRACARMMLIGLLRSLNAWKAFAEATPRESGVLLRWKNNRLAMGWESWLDYMRMLDVARRAAAGMVSGGLLRGFNAWYEFAEEAARKYALLHRSVQVLRSVSLRRCWNTLCELLDAPPDPAARAVAYLVHRELAKGWESWKDFTAEQQTKRRCLAALRFRGLRQGLASWVAFTDERHAALQSVRASLGHFFNLFLSRAWNAWTGWIAERSDSAAPAKRAVMHWMSMKVVRALNTWEAMVAKRALLRKALRNLAMASARKALNSWVELAAVWAAERGKMAAVLRRFSPDGRAQARALSSWQSRVDELKLMRRAAAALASAGLAKSWRKWEAVVGTAAQLRLALVRMRSASLVRALNMWRRAPATAVTPAVKRAASRLTNVPLARAFETWSARCDELMAMGRAAAYLSQRGLAMAWRSWDDFLCVRELMRSAASALLSASLRRGYNTWVSWADEKLETESRIRSVLLSMTSQLRAAFNAWAEYDDAPRFFLAQAVGHLAHRELSAAWNTWLESLEARERLRAAVAHMTGQGLVKAFGSWEAFLEDRRLMLKAASAMQFAGLRMAFTTWCDYVSGTVEALDRLRSIVSAFSGPLRRALNTWITHAAERDEQRRALLRLLHVATSRAWNAWLEFLDAKAANIEKMRQALVAGTSGLRVGMNTWMEYAADRKAAIAALSCFRDLGLRRGFNTWAEASARGIEAEDLMHSALSSLRYADLRKALNSWTDWIECMAPLRHAASHMLFAALSRAIHSWDAYLDAEAVKNRALLAFINVSLARGLRGWLAALEQQDANRFVVARVLNYRLCRALRHWQASGHEREAKMQRMRTLLYTLAGGHQCKRALNSWKGLVSGNERARRAALAFVHGASIRAWNKWRAYAVEAARSKKVMRSALRVAERKAFNSWRENAADDFLGRRALSYWLKAELVLGFRKWRVGLRSLERLRRSLAHFTLFAAVKALNTWISRVAEAFTLRRALGAFANSALRKGWNSWLHLAELRRLSADKARAGLRIMMHSEVKRALNTWIAAKAALNPLRRGIAHWRNAPLKKAFNSMSHNVRRREKMRAVVYRLRHRLVSKAVVTWRARIASGLLRRLTKLGKAWVHHPKRKALNTWIAYYRGQRRLLGLVKTFKGDATRRGFNTWRAATQRRLGITLGAPNNLRSIRAMTWREAVGWLHSMGIRVSRSPPTLLRTLRAGGPYQDLIRLCSLTFYMRHKVSQIANALTLFSTLQHFFETELVVRVIGCQRLDVAALEGGRAIEHLELLSSIREVLDEVRAQDLISPVDVVVENGVLYGGEL